MAGSDRLKLTWEGGGRDVSTRATSIFARDVGLVAAWLSNAEPRLPHFTFTFTFLEILVPLSPGPRGGREENVGIIGGVPPARGFSSTPVPS